MPSARHPITARCALLLVTALLCVPLSACSSAPMLSKADLDSGKLPKKHPKLTAPQQANCRGCHRERPDAPAK